MRGEVLGIGREQCGVVAGLSLPSQVGDKLGYGAAQIMLVSGQHMEVMAGSDQGFDGLCDEKDGARLRYVRMTDATVDEVGKPRQCPCRFLHHCGKFALNALSKVDLNLAFIGDIYLTALAFIDDLEASCDIGRVAFIQPPREIEEMLFREKLKFTLLSKAQQRHDEGWLLVVL